MIKKIKLILKSVREYKKQAILTPIFMVGEVALECAIPYVMSLFLDKIEEMGMSIQFNVLLPYIIGLVAMAMASLLFGVLGGRTAAVASTGLARNLRSDLYKKLQSFSFENIDKFSNSSLVTRMTTDVTNAQQSFQMCIRIVVRAPLMLIFSIIMAFINGGNMAWIFIGIVPVVALGLIFIMKLAMPVFQRVFKRYDALNESVQENVSAIRVVKSFVREDYEQKKFNTASDNITKEFIKAEKILSFTNPIMNFSIHLSNVLVCAIGAKVIYDSNKTALTIPQLSSLLTYGVQILMSLMMISMIIVMLAMSLESIRRIAEVLEEEPTIENPENPIHELDDGSIVFKNVNFKYKEKAEKYTLSNINLDIKSGQFIGIIGSTGSGKSTLVNLISRLYDTKEGAIIVGGHDVKEYDLDSLRNNVAVVLQKNVLFSGTIEDNLRWGDENASLDEIIKASKIAQADEFVSTFKDGYKTYIEQGGTNVSGGQKQRLCIARAILKKPKILILDDSTSAVDTKTDKLIRMGLRNEIPNTTKIVIAQRISSIEDADQIIVLDDGHIDQIGTHEELLKTNAIYQEVYNTQTKNGGDK
ncbi:MAG: ABC transporter ATP-binding protein/permease [Erysipelotrichaceae bacterium]|nr:ABC transporter ATP-binding protein/permease [Erysipelotrichaceae bacterium]